jgi:DNA invertase Pin-like site-specific DNA recombinase
MDSLNEVSHINYSQQKGKWPLMSYEEPGLGSIGYARVSTADQNADLQHAALKAAGCHRIFTARGVSESRASWPELDKMLDYLRDGDEVVVWKLDRLGRNTRKLLALIDELERRGVHFRSVTERISTTGSMGRAMLTVMSAFAQLECDQLAERTRKGMPRPPNPTGRPDGRK